MAVIPINQLKNKFESGDRPTESDYQDLIDTTAFHADSLGGDGNNYQTINGLENETIFDTIDTSTWRTIKYLVQMSNASSGFYKSTEISIVFDGQNQHISEFGTVSNTENEIGIISANLNNGIIEMRVNPVITPMTLRFYKTGLKV